MRTLDQLRIGERAEVIAVTGNGAIHQRLLEMGVVGGMTVKVVRFAPLGDPMEIEVCGYHLLLRKAEAAMVAVKPVVAEPTHA